MSNYVIKQGNCLELMKRLPDKSVDLVVTSPPYDNLRNYKGYSWDFEGIAKELYRIVKDGGVVVWIVNDATINGSGTGTSFRQALYFKEIGFNIHDTMIWNKISCPFPDKTRYYQSFEYMFVFSKGKIGTFNPIQDRKNKRGGDKVHGTRRQPDGSLTRPNGLKVGRLVKEYGVRFNVWDTPPERNNKTIHPAVFPLQLAKDHVLSWSNQNDTVLDPFMGSGTTGLACLQTNRKFIGFEISEEYFKLSKERLEKEVTNELR